MPSKVVSKPKHSGYPGVKAIWTSLQCHLDHNERLHLDNPQTYTDVEAFRLSIQVYTI